MKACIFKGNGQSRLVDMPIPEISDTEVLLRVLVCGLCTSELETWRADYGNGRLLGHEAVAIIEKTGPGVIGFKKGDRVTGLIYKAFAEYTKADYRQLVKVPESLDDVEALGEPLSCLLSGIRRIENLPCRKAAVIGTGFMGLGMIQFLKLMGAEHITAVDIRRESLNHSLRYGADTARFPHEVLPEETVTSWDRMDGGFDVVVEASGSQTGLDLAGKMTAVHGTMAIAGYHQGGPRTIDMELWNWKGITVINAHERRDWIHIECMEEALSLVNDGFFDMKSMITHSFTLDELDQAFQTLIRKPEGFIKAVLSIGRQSGF